MAAPNDLETNVPIGNEGDSSADTVATFIDALKEFGEVDFSALGLVANASSFARCKAGTNNYAYGLGVDSGLPGSILLYTHGMGMECPEWVSWYFQGSAGIGAALDTLLGLPPTYAGMDSGEALVDALLTTADPTNPFFLPVLTRSAEGAGWFKEAPTLKKFQDGLWSDGSQIKLRQFGEGKPAMNAAFPNVQTPPATTGISFLGDVQAGVWNGGEYNEPYGDAAVINGLFPNWPSGQGGIIEAGMKHYVMSSWHTPARVRNVWVNRTIWTALTAAQKNHFRYAAMASCLKNIAIAYQGQDAIVKNFQALGCTIHEHLPPDVVALLREGFTDAQNTLAAADGTGAYSALLEHQRLFIKANHVRWRAGNENRKMRFDRYPYNSNFQPNSTY